MSKSKSDLIYIHVYKIIITSVPIMCHDVNKETFSNLFSKEEDYQGDCGLLLQWKNYYLLFIIYNLFFIGSSWCTNTINTLAWYNSETKRHLKMKFCADACFYEKLCSKINWNVDRVPLKSKTGTYIQVPNIILSIKVVSTGKPRWIKVCV